MGWKHGQTVDPRKREPQVGRGLFGIRLLNLHVNKTRFTLEEIVPDSLMFPDSSNLEYPDL